MDSSDQRRSSISPRIEEFLDQYPNDEQDFSFIYDTEWPNEVAKSRTENIRPYLLELYKTQADVNSQMGMPLQLINQRLDDFDQEVIRFIKETSEIIEGDREKVKEFHRKKLAEIEKMLKDLHLEPYVQTESMPLWQSARQLKDKFRELNNIKQKRLSRLEQLKERQIKLCLSLGIEPPKVRLETDIPSEDELISLMNAVTNLEKEEKRRLDNYNSIKAQIKNFVELSDYVPEIEFERSILTNDPCLTEAHLLEMSNYKAKLESIYAENKQRFDKMSVKLASLYKRLKFGTENINDLFPDCKPSTLAEMEVEVERCEKEKERKIKEFIEETRKELVDYCARCYLKKDEELLSLSDSGEHLLKMYELELERYQVYYKTYERVFDRIRDWDEKFEELKECKEAVNDPVVRKNRGGILDRKLKRCRQLELKTLPELQKELRLLEEEIRTNDDSKKENEGKFEGIYGSAIDDYIEMRWNELQLTKPQVIVKKTPMKRAAGAATPTPSKLQCKKSFMDTPTNSTFKSNHTLTSSAVKRPKFAQPTPSKKTALITNVNTRNHLNSSSSNRSDFSSGLSLSEHDFEEMIRVCPTSAKRR